MKEAKANVEALVEFIRNLTPAQAEKLVQRMPLFARLAEMHEKDLTMLEKFLCQGNECVH